MIKFEDVNSRVLEIASAFYHPARMYLNRPLITLLEWLGVKPEVFMKLQRTALDEVHKAAGSFETAAKLLESHGLGTAYRLPSLFTSLYKLQARDKDGAVKNLLKNDDFFRRVLDFAINHIRRELKYKARIPVPKSWTLVGVVDVHDYLKEGEIFGPAFLSRKMRGLRVGQPASALETRRRRYTLRVPSLSHARQ